MQIFFPYGFQLSGNTLIESNFSSTHTRFSFGRWHLLVLGWYKVSITGVKYRDLRSCAQMSMH